MSIIFLTLMILNCFLLRFINEMEIVQTSQNTSFFLTVKKVKKTPTVGLRHSMIS